MAYLTGVLTDLLHTQRDPLALCLLLQSYDQLEPPSLPCRHRLSGFNRYYSLWIPEPALEALVSHATQQKPGLPFPGKPRRPLPVGRSSLYPSCVAFLSSQGELSSPSRFPWLEEEAQW